MSLSKWEFATFSVDSQRTASRLRLMRWLPTVPLAIATVALWLQAAGIDGDLTSFANIAFLVAIMMFSSGTWRIPTPGEPLNDRERLLNVRALSAGAHAAFVLAMLGAIAFASRDYLGTWEPSTLEDWLVVLFSLGTVYICVQLLYLSWSLRPIDEQG